MTDQSRSITFGASLQMVFQQNFKEFVKYMEESTISLRKLVMGRISVWLKTENYCHLQWKSSNIEFHLSLSNSLQNTRKSLLWHDKN